MYKIIIFFMVLMLSAPVYAIDGNELLEKIVKRSGNSGRIYVSPDWGGLLVKVVRVE